MANPTTKPGKEIDDDVLIMLSSYYTTYEELAAHFKTTVTWLHNNKREVIERGRTETKVKLRKKQLQIAFDDTHPRQPMMLTFLGKAILGQRETSEVVNITKEEDNNFNVTFK